MSGWDNVKLMRACKEDRHLIASLAFTQANISDDDLAVFQVHKSHLVLKGPVYVGMRSLISPSTSCTVAATTRSRPSQLLYTGSNSLLLEIQTEAVYKDMDKHRHIWIPESALPSQHSKQ